MKTITYLTEADYEKFESSVYRTIILNTSSLQGYIGIDVDDRKVGHQGSITLTVQEMERVVEFYKRNVEVK